MLVAHYRLAAAFAASFSLALAGCGSNPPVAAAGASGGTPGASDPQPVAKRPPAEMDTESTILTVLGLARKSSEHEPGPQTGNTVSPILWQAAHETLSFVKFDSEDPLTGLLVSDWYSPKGKPDERYKINVFILSRELRSDSLAVTVDRQVRSATGQWEATTIARKVEDDLENAILLRAGQLKRDWLKEWKSG
jgi:Domain of unknown function (DUF3576)